MNRKTLATGIGLVLIIWLVLICLMFMSGPKKMVGTPLPKAHDYVEIGNGIRRTNDLEMGVVCYTKSNASLSCLKVNQ